MATTVFFGVLVVARARTLARSSGRGGSLEGLYAPQEYALDSFSTWLLDVPVNTIY